MSVSCYATVKNERGIHARPSSVIAKESLKFKSDITIQYNGKTANAKASVEKKICWYNSIRKYDFIIENQYR